MKTKQKFKISNLQSTRLPSPEGEVNGGQAMERSDLNDILRMSNWKLKIGNCKLENEKGKKNKGNKQFAI